jgi:hypothetical protein
LLQQQFWKLERKRVRVFVRMEVGLGLVVKSKGELGMPMMKK